ncbi:MAG: hypothetical protein Q7L55_02410 [Actinomycetota bacterium]|nr:hypothetical protein [Actinomycetota bacterium]
MRMKQSTLALAVCTFAFASVLSACASNEQPTITSSSSATSALDPCDQPAITTAVHDFYAATSATQSAGLDLQSVSSVECAGDWAVARIVVGDGQGHDLQDYEVAQRVDGAWVVADRMTVCGTWNPKRPSQIPDDAQIDARLYSSACTAA